MSEIDYRYWTSLDRWQAKEAALLLDGKDPDQHKAVKLTGSDIPAGYENAAKIAKLLSRIDWKGRYGFEAFEVSNSPVFIVKTLSDAGWPVPERLLESISPLLRKLENRFLEEEADRALPTSTAATKERQTMLKLILGLACAGYGIDPSSTRNPKAKEMREDLERVGLPLDDGTIKKYLDEARLLYRKLIAK